MFVNRKTPIALEMDQPEIKDLAAAREILFL